MACRGAILSMLGMSAVGAVLGGAGLANFAKSIANGLTGSAAIGSQMGALDFMGGLTSGVTSVSGIVSAGLNPLSVITNGLPGVLQSVGTESGIWGAINDTIGDGFEQLVGSGFLDAVSEHSTELFGSTIAEALELLGGTAAQFSALSQEIAPGVQHALTAAFGQYPGTGLGVMLEGGLTSGAWIDPDGAMTRVLPADGDFGNFLGRVIPNVTALLTNGLSQFTNDTIDISGFAGDLYKIGGAFDLGDSANFGNPGQLVSKILAAGGGGITGVTSALVDVGYIDAEDAGTDWQAQRFMDKITNLGTNLASQQFNGILNDALSRITNPEMIQNAQDILGSNLEVSSMADFTNLQKVLPVSFDKVPFNTFNDLQTHLSGLNLGTIETAKQLGEVLDAITIANLPTISNTTSPVDYNALANITEKFLGGSGPYGEIYVSDLMGSLGGIGLNTESKLYKAATTEMDDLGAFTTLRLMYTELSNGMAGNYLDVPGDPAASTTITDPRDGSTHTDLDSFVFKKIEQIRTEITGIAGNSTWSEAFGIARNNWKAMQEQINNEKIHAAKTDLQLDSRNGDPESVYHFAANMVPRAAQTDVTKVLEGMCDGAVEANDVSGEYWRAFIAECKNRNVVEPHDINWRGQDNTVTVPI
jgi:hypothetical protein